VTSPSGPTAPAARTPRSTTRVALVVTVAILAVLIVGFLALSGLYADILWYDQLGYLSVLTTQWIASGVMFVVGFVATFLVVFVSILVAFRTRPMYAKLSAQLDRYQQVIEPLRRLAMFGIPAVLGIFVGVSTSTRWSAVLQFLNRTPFGETDAQFGLDLSFFVYELPFFRGRRGRTSRRSCFSRAVAALATAYLYGGSPGDRP